MNLQHLTEKLLDWIYPPQCVSCGAPGSLFCSDCRSALQLVGDHYCNKCGKPLTKGKSCRLCRISDFPFQASRAPYIYEGPAAALIKKLKYDGCLNLVPILSDRLYAFWKGLGWEADMIVPVPLSEKRRTQRGFNQSEMIGRPFAKKAGIPIEPGALMKIRHTVRQVGLNAEERRENLSGAFAAEQVMVQGKRILLLDDVMTTGSTFAECSAVLLKAGAGSVKCLSFATTSEDHGSQDMLNSV